MRITDFDLYRDLLKEKSGLTLSPEKSYQVESRLTPIAKKWGYPSLEAMTITLRAVPDRDLLADVVEAMIMPDTSFFRDRKVFENFRDKALPFILKNRAAKKQMKIWCAASSSGQEPYSLALLIKEYGAKTQGWKVDILANDISSILIEQAREGIYSQLEVQRGLGMPMLLKYFTQDGNVWRINNDIRKMVRFDIFNLLNEMPGANRFDAIFCRNVLDSFDEDTQITVLEKLAAQLDKDGFLFLGAKENMGSLITAFVPLPGTSGIYVHAGSRHLSA